MPISVACSCGKQFRVRDENAGKRGKCPECGRGLHVPDPQNADVTDVPPSSKVATPPASIDLYGDDDDDPNLHHRVSDFINNLSPEQSNAPIAGTPPPLPKAAHATAATFSPKPPGTISEPWYYGFLEKYAQVGNILGLIVFALGMLGTTGIAFGARRYSDNMVSTIITLLAGVITFGLIYVGILFSVALILLAVNAGRNLIAIRQILQSKE